MKKAFLLFVLFSLLGCTLQYEGEERLVVTGKLIDKYNNPIQSNNVEVWIHMNEQQGGIYPSGGDQDLISFTQTDANGNFRMLFPKPINEDEIELKFYDKDNIYQNKSYINIKKSNFIDYTFTANTITLYKKEDITLLKVILNNVNPANQIERISLIGQTAESLFWVNPLENNENFYYYDSYFHEVAKNQTLIMEYDVKDFATQQITTLQQTINIGTDNETEFTLDY
ncbi:hypothetical protein FSS13T_13940 [Flavobacterium saliperosum S13]|uniref:Carboxypeptidase regulatory-like domain-containing protein n=2 Tax=Flavobacterium saliperosum TaxID=329186 RepID=A0A1G4VFM9_9FLAO|nr:hypothetical protein [Flavobacterium saliperosum]ESU25926.1 hypothetical protein FSS13T_13940 [Flavobacterium saliperosum S13]SCX05474.1 hypothetical protein SAMN02927925_00827 [Flavobacterium saliperosum]